MVLVQPLRRDPRVVCLVGPTFCFAIPKAWKTGRLTEPIGVEIQSGKKYHRNTDRKQPRQPFPPRHLAETHVLQNVGLEQGQY